MIEQYPIAPSPERLAAEGNLADGSRPKQVQPWALAARRLASHTEKEAQWKHHSVAPHGVPNFAILISPLIAEAPYPNGSCTVRCIGDGVAA